jgi:hypothetical protein
MLWKEERLDWRFAQRLDRKQIGGTHCLYRPPELDELSIQEAVELCAKSVMDGALFLESAR